MKTNTLATSLIIALAFALGGCAPYVNIPGQSADIAFDSPNLGTVKQAEIKALKAAIAQQAYPGQFQIVLPEYSNAATYEQVTQAVSKAAVWSSQGVSADLPVVEVAAVYIRGNEAEVEVLMTADANQPRGPRRKLTVHLGHGMFEEWSVERTRLWQFTVDAPPVGHGALPAKAPKVKADDSSPESAQGDTGKGETEGDAKGDTSDAK